MPLEPIIARPTLTEEVRNQIMQKIVSHQWEPGYMLPSEPELARIFDVSQGTVRRALRELVNEGCLIRHQGKGTFVASRRRRSLGKHHNWFCLNGEETSEKRTPHTDPEIKLFELTEATARVAAALEISPGSPVFHICRDITYENIDTVCCFDEIFLPQDRFAGLTLPEMIRKSNRDLYAFYEESFRQTVFTIEEIARAVFLNPEQAQKAGVPLPYPGIRIQRIGRDVAGKPVELRYMTNATDIQNLILSLNRHV